MKKIYRGLFLLLLFVCPITAWGQLSSGWFTDFSLGIQTPFVGGTSDAKFGYQTTPYYSIAVGNQLVDEFSLRLKVEGSSLRSCYNVKAHDTNYMMLHLDVMPSLSHLFFKGDEQKWDVLPYVGLGYYHGFAKEELKSANMLSVHFGAKAVWNVWDRVGLFLEGGIAVLPNEFDRYPSKRNQEGIGSLALGITWYLGK